LKHAFAVEPSGPAEPTPEQRAIVDRLCREIVRRHLTAPALLYLEVSRPLNYLGSQAMHFFRPIVAALFDTRGYEQFACFLERRGSVDYLCARLEYFEAEGTKRKPDSAAAPSAEDSPRQA
jgi:hypothetical protein